MSHGRPTLQPREFVDILRYLYGKDCFREVVCPELVVATWGSDVLKQFETFADDMLVGRDEVGRYHRMPMRTVKFLEYKLRRTVWRSYR